MANGKSQMANGLGMEALVNYEPFGFCPLPFNLVFPRRSLENHVIPAKAGIHCVPDQMEPPAFAGVTRRVILIPWGWSKAHDHVEETPHPSGDG